MKDKSSLQYLIFTAMAVGVFAMSLFGSPLSARHVAAQSIGHLREASEQLQSDISNNQAAANEKDHHADTLEGAIGALDGQISDASQQISDTSNRIDQLTNDLAQKQAELDKAKKLLKINMEALYKRGDATTVELIVGSDSFSEFMDEQEYLERIKTGIQDSANQVIELKKQITAQRAEKQEQLAKQKAAKEALDGARAQRADLLVKTRGEEAHYREVVKDLEAQRAAVDNEISNIIAAAARAAAASSGGAGGQAVASGQMIGRVGSTGYSTGPHVHFEMFNSAGQRVNPYGLMGGWPVNGYVSQGYGCVADYYVYSTKCSDGHSFHPGIDIAASYGAPVYATKPGVIIWKGWDGAYGNKVVVKHTDGTFSWYGHLSSF